MTEYCSEKVLRRLEKWLNIYLSHYQLNKLTNCFFFLLNPKTFLLSKIRRDFSCLRSNHFGDAFHIIKMGTIIAKHATYIRAPLAGVFNTIFYIVVWSKNALKVFEYSFNIFFTHTLAERRVEFYSFLCIDIC